MDAEPGAAGRVIVVGSINLDLVLRVPRLPRAGETVTGGTLARHHGGKGANQAVAAARAGATTYLTGAVGASDGDASVQALAAEGIDVSGVARLRGEHTGHAVVLVDSAGENQIAVASGANAAVAPGNVRAHLSGLRLTASDVIVVSFELPDPPLLAAAAAAGQAGAAVVVNPAPARACDPALLRGAVITPNRHELAAMLDPAAGVPLDPPPRTPAGTVAEAVADAARWLARRTGGRVVATLGPEGALLADGTSVTHFPGHRVPARDSTGAGDALTGVLAAGIAAGAGLPEALRRAVAAAALTVTRTGARQGMPRAAEIDALLESDAPDQVIPRTS